MQSKLSSYLVEYSAQNFLKSSLLSFLIMSSVLRISFLRITLMSLCCCRVSRETLSGKSSESTTPRTKFR